MNRNDEGREKKEEKVEEEEVEELRQVLGAISDFLKEIRGPLKDLLGDFMNALKGDALGEDVGNFYKKLLASGVPKELAEKMTEEYFRKRLATADVLGKLMDLFRGGRKMIAIATSPEEAEKYLKLAKELKGEKAREEEEEEED